MNDAERDELLIRLETIVTNMDHRLFGNGQPGVVKEHEDRLKVVENFRYYLLGIGAVIAVIGVALINHIFGTPPKP